MYTSSFNNSKNYAPAAIALSFFILCLYACTPADTSREGSTADTAKKTVVDAEPLLPDSVLATKKTVYISCDDGPNFGSDIVMNIAQQENIPVSFFCVGLQFTGENSKRYFGKTWERMHTQPGVEVYNHGFTHALWNKYEFFYARPDTVVYDFNRANDSAKYPNKIMRANGNNIWRTSTVNHDTYKRYNPAIDSLTAHGYTIVGWDAEWRHYKFALRQTPEQMAAEVDAMFTSNNNFTPHHCMLLLHEQSLADTADSEKFHQFIKLLKQKPEYRFEKVSRYPGLVKRN